MSQKACEPNDGWQSNQYITAGTLHKALWPNDSLKLVETQRKYRLFKACLLLCFFCLLWWKIFLGRLLWTSMSQSNVKLPSQAHRSLKKIKQLLWLYVFLLSWAHLFVFFGLFGVFLWLLEVKEWTFLLFLHDCVDESISALLFWCIWIVFCNRAFWQWSQTNSGSNHRALNRTYIEQQWATDIM